MARNIEIKARIADRNVLIFRVEALADYGPVVIDQDDTFFHCPDGRLKLRELSTDQGELILYHRPDVSAPKTSTYVISQTSDPEKMREILSAVLGVAGRIRKNRILYMSGRTRIHIDDVEGLGNFLEIEVVLDESVTVESGQRVAEEFMSRFGIQPEDLVMDAYVDMLAASDLENVVLVQAVDDKTGDIGSSATDARLSVRHCTMPPDLKQLLHSDKLDTLVTMLASDQVPVVQDAAEAIVSYLLATFPDAQQTTARLSWLRRLTSETPLLLHDLQPNERLRFYQFCAYTLYPTIVDALPLIVRLQLLADLELIVSTLPAEDNPALQRRLKAIITSRFGSTLGMTSNTRLARQKMQQALVVMEPLVNTESPDMTDIAALSSMYRRLGNLEKHTSAAAGRHWFDKAMALQETLTTQYPDDLNYQSMLADTYVCRGSVAAETDDDQGSTWFLKHLRIYRQLARMGYQPLESARALTVAYENMGICRLENSPHAARRWLQKSYRIRVRQLAEKPSISVLDDYFVICNLLNKANAGCGRHDVAEEFLERALEAARELYHQDPKNIRHSGILALAYQRSATMYKRKDTEQTRLLYQRSQELLYELIRSGVVTPEFCCMALESLEQLERVEVALDGRSQTIWQDRIKEMNTLLEDFL